MYNATLGLVTASTSHSQQPQVSDYSRQSDGFTTTLEVVDLSNPPEYIAMSYYWGDTRNLVPIVCDGDTIMVTTNIRAMVKHFSCAVVGVWIDAICINHKDILERNSQVALMADIYSKAATVAVWMGDDLDGEAEEIGPWFQKTFDALAAICELGANITKVHDDTGEVQAVLPNGRAFQVDLLEGIFPDSDEVMLLSRVLSLPWFQRTWIIQEVGLAVDATLVWATTSMQWHPIGLIAMFLVRFARSLLVKTGLVEVIERVHHIYTAYSPFTPLTTFFHLLINARRFKASDPRDKVFAFLSHATSSTIGPIAGLPRNASAYRSAFTVAVRCLPSIQDEWLVKQVFGQLEAKHDPNVGRDVPLIKADYGKNVEQVYRDVAIEHIRRTSSLEMLSAVQHHPSAVDLSTPSWVPRWDKHIDSQLLGLWTSIHFAARNRDAILTLPTLSSPTHLVVRGHIISRIMYASSVLSTKQFDLTNPRDLEDPDWLDANPIASTWQSTSLSTVHNSNVLYPALPFMMLDNGTMMIHPRSSILTAYLRTWSAGHGGRPTIIDIPAGRSNDLDFVRDSFAYFERLFPPEKPPQVRTRLSAGLLGELELMEIEEAEYRAKEEQNMRAERYRRVVATVSNQRKFFITKKYLMGLGPGALRVGDWVAVLLGADVPFVLREVDGDGREPGPFRDDVKFQLVGECYVDGIMAGEGITGVEVKRDITLV